MIKAVVNIDIGCYEQIQEPSFENSTWDFYTITDLRVGNIANAQMSSFLNLLS